MTIGDIRRRFGLLYSAGLSSVSRLASNTAVIALLLVAASSAGCRAVSTDSGTSTAPADIDRLKMLVPSQSHTMQDVGFHWTNLWFAGQQGNWPLARFYFDEARQHIQWTIQVRPIRKDADGRDVDLQSIFQAVDSSLFAAVNVAIERKDAAQFATAYKSALDGCYTCHKSSGKPYLRPGVPTAPAQTIIDFSPEMPGGTQ
jgi:cytochrome c553